MIYDRVRRQDWSQNPVILQQCGFSCMRVTSMELFIPIITKHSQCHVCVKNATFCNSVSDNFR